MFFYTCDQFWGQGEVIYSSNTCCFVHHIAKNCLSFLWWCCYFYCSSFYGFYLFQWRFSLSPQLKCDSFHNFKSLVIWEPQMLTFVNALYCILYLDVPHHPTLWRCAGEKYETGSRERQTHCCERVSSNAYIGCGLCHFCRPPLLFKYPRLFQTEKRDKYDVILL